MLVAGVKAVEREVGCGCVVEEGVDGGYRGVVYEVG